MFCFLWNEGESVTSDQYLLRMKESAIAMTQEKQGLNWKFKLGWLVTLFVPFTASQHFAFQGNGDYLVNLFVHL